MSKFKAGDRVYFVAIYGSKKLEGLGTVFECFDNEVYIEMDNKRAGKIKSIVVDYSDSREFVVLEELYNTPLWKAMKE